MMKMKFKGLLVALMVMGSFLGMNAADYVTIAKEGTVYDEANAKYPTMNQFSEDITVLPGMVFATTEHTPGWYKIEYLPGIHGFIPEQIVSGNFNPVKAGTYTVANNPDWKLTVEGSGDNWSASANGETYKGVKSQEVLVFYNNSNDLMYSLVDIGNGPVVMTYDNTITCFF